MLQTTSRPPQCNDSRFRYVGGALVILLHVVIVGALLQVVSMRSRAAKAAPVFVKLVPLPAQLPDPSPPPPETKKVVRKQPPRLTVTEVPAVSPTEFVATERASESASVDPAVEPKAETITPPAPVAPVSKVISKVEYIRAPQLEYPALSRRIGEQGRVLLRVLIGREGRAERVEIQTSSGSRRLDEAAIKAAREALYRPYSENGVAIPVWAFVPTLFELS